MKRKRCLEPATKIIPCRSHGM